LPGCRIKTHPPSVKIKRIWQKLDIIHSLKLLTINKKFEKSKGPHFLNKQASNTKQNPKNLKKKKPPRVSFNLILTYPFPCLSQESGKN